MPPYSDVYVLSRERSAAAADQFLNMFAPDREHSAEDYVFPQYADQPVAVVKSAMEAIRYCEEHPAEEQGMYFRNLGAGPAHAMLFFTSDGGLIFGLSVVEREDEWFTRLKEYAGSEVGYITFEVPPPGTSTEFKEQAARVAEPHS